MRRVISKLAALATVLAAGQASADVTVGGIVFDSSLLPGHLETTTLAETLIFGNGQTLRGYGVVNTVNGNSSYCAAGPCQLYFKFDNYVSQNFSATNVEFTGGALTLYRYVLRRSDQSDCQHFRHKLCQYWGWSRLDRLGAVHRCK